jgi:hypothetical protein
VDSLCFANLANSAKGKFTRADESAANSTPATLDRKSSIDNTREIDESSQDEFSQEISQARARAHVPFFSFLPISRTEDQSYVS